jgi:hypothetical protein
MLIHWKPTTKQQEALARIEFEILYGGARGGGKTDAGQAWLLYDKDHPLYKGLVIRKNADDLSDWSERAKRMYAPTRALFTGQPPLIRFPGGAFVKTGHLKDENAYEKYQGHEYQKILIEEIEQIPSEDSYLKLISSCRSTVRELRPQVFCTANPGGRGHSWIKRRWNLSGIPTRPVITQDKITGRYRVFIPARVDDNPHLMENDPSYVKFLDSLPDGLREAWRHGSWDDVEIKGAYYGAALAQARREGRIKTVPYDPSLKVHDVWDLGVGKQLAIGFYQRTSNETRLIDFHIGDEHDGIPQGIKACKDRPYIYGKHFAPHDIETTDTGTGVTRIETAKKLGWNFIVVPKLSFDDGINAGKLMFSHFWIDEQKCEQFIESIRQYRREWDEKLLTYKQNPVKDWTNHAGDVHRYASIIEKQMTNEDSNFQNIMRKNEENYIENEYE